MIDCACPHMFNRDGPERGILEIYFKPCTEYPVGEPDEEPNLVLIAEQYFEKYGDRVSLQQIATIVYNTALLKRFYAWRFKARRSEYDGMTPEDDMAYDLIREANGTRGSGESVYFGDDGTGEDDESEGSHDCECSGHSSTGSDAEMTT